MPAVTAVRRRTLQRFVDEVFTTLAACTLAILKLAQAYVRRHKDCDPAPLKRGIDTTTFKRAAIEIKRLSVNLNLLTRCGAWQICISAPIGP